MKILLLVASAKIWPESGMLTVNITMINYEVGWLMGNASTGREPHQLTESPHNMHKYLNFTSIHPLAVFSQNSLDQCPMPTNTD